MSKVVRPRDAAGLILLKESKPETFQVYLGRRHAKARFMPGVFVFPGGGLDAADARPSGLTEGFRPAPPSLDAATRRSHEALARAALRELFEETGCLLGAPGQAASQAPQSSPAWRAYAEAKLTPAFPDLHLIARAITPAGRPIRFHTRFFLAAGPQALSRVAEGDGELEELGWYPVEAALGDLPTPGITEKVLSEALAAHKAIAKGQPFPPVRYTARGAQLYIRRQAQERA